MSDTDTTTEEPTEENTAPVPYPGDSPGTPLPAPPAEEETTEAPAEETKPESDSDRAAPTDLEGDVKSVVDGIVTGQLALPDGKSATPHVLAVMVGKFRDDRGDTPANKSNTPSSGAVAACLDRWVNYGFITMSEGPKAFDDFTQAGRTEGLAALKAKHRGSLSSARAAEKAANAPAPEPEAEPEAEPEQEETEPVLRRAPF